MGRLAQYGEKMTVLRTATARKESANSFPPFGEEYAHLFYHFHLWHLLARHWNALPPDSICKLFLHKDTHQYMMIGSLVSQVKIQVDGDC